METTVKRIVLVTSFVLVYVAKEAQSIECYYCTQTAPPPHTNQTAKLCSSFDRSRHYVKECPYSTMCMKKTYEYEPMVGKKILATLRDCAPQRYKYQAFKGGAWQMESSIEEPYEEGCHVDENTKNTVYCYCRGYLCNGGSPSKKKVPQIDLGGGYHTDAMAVIFVFNAMKYLRSDR